MVSDDCVGVCVCVCTQVCSKASLPTGLLPPIMMMMKVIWLLSHQPITTPTDSTLLSKFNEASKQPACLFLQAANRLARWNPYLIALCRRLCFSRCSHWVLNCTLNFVSLPVCYSLPLLHFLLFHTFSPPLNTRPLSILNWSRWTSGMNGKYYVEAHGVAMIACPAHSARHS